jgi:signal transduction histidine kinase
MDRLATQLDAHCRGMLTTGVELGGEADLLRLLGAFGEVVDPALPFGTLEMAARDAPGRTVFLADDRGQVVAWGGAGNSFPHSVRPLGQRQWGVSWSIGSADLWLREPVLVEGRLVGAIIVSDRSPLEGDRLWGMRATSRYTIRVGIHRSGAEMLRPDSGPGVEVPVAVARDAISSDANSRWFGWLLLAVAALALEPRLAWLVVTVGGASMLTAAESPPPVAAGLAVLLAGASLGRLARALPPVWSRALVLATVTGAAVFAVFGVPAERLDWLPELLLRPGWGGVWMVALAWLVAGWPGLSDGGVGLDRRLGIAAPLAVLGLCVYLARVPVELVRHEAPGPGVVLPRGDLDMASLLPAPAGDCRLEDLAAVLAKRWELAGWRTPSELRFIDDEGFEVSRWGDLTPAGENVRVVRQWPLDEPPGYSLELLVATEPWSWLRDWRTGLPLEDVRDSEVWFAALTRSGKVAASLHPEFRNLDAMRAGELFHAEGGWALIEIGDSSRLARVRRQGQWLVLAVSHYPSTSDWVVRTAVALLWALLGTLVALPPKIGRQDLSTFGGRLQLLVAGGVVVPLAILTLVLHQRISAEELRLERARGLEALQAARYTAVHLGGGFAVDDELARWLAAGWGGEVALWDGINLVAVSRPDLVSTGALPQLPEAEAFPAYLVGGNDPMILRWQDRLVAAGPVDLGGFRLLLHLYRSDSGAAGSDLGAVDWLLTGALLSALLALLLTTRVEERLSASLRDLVVQARKLLDGEPVGQLPRPRESDLAEVLDAVGSMNEEVQQREINLRYQEELLRITLKTLEQAVVVLEPDGTERFANPSAHKLQEEYGDLFLEELHAVVEHASIGGSATKTIQPVTGRDLTWRIGVAGVPFPDGARGLVAVVDDVTDLVRADRMRQLNQLARIVAHEVKNPLTPIRLWVQELEAAADRDDPELPQLLEEACREIGEQVSRLQETANSFSNLVALEKWEAEPVDLASIVRERDGGSGILERRGIHFEIEITSPPPPPVMGDRHWLRRLFANLVQNSIDALGDGPGTVTVGLSAEDGKVVLVVEDTGGGVPDERLPELFAPHFSTTTAGSGLGLALVHQVVIRCHGRVAASNAERGLQVRLEFPAG